ncbi:Atu4866 domain-containing protein [Actinoalloteichus fjordicus]|uniref:Uncharacterized protein n=1 Tax=Actinoalloteichus fjordicus TaxID=1612552 RepID=A0AAC9LEW8_9PSEU|nr:Atu4866 domain-containing protein [Actinoalloteichus fjordicus]APU15497.1 hypothetical protein UA74_17335 [Actinoalloteichus fjordicus]
MQASDYCGLWVTEDGRIRHRLLPTGRYDEARDQNEHAYQGDYRIDGDHIDYRDDTGFSADGDFVDGVLHHAGMILYRRPDFSPAAGEEIELARRQGPHRPLLFTGARLLTGDPLIGDVERGDVLLAGQTIAGIGPGLLTAADDDGAIVVDCRDTVIIPAVVDLLALHSLRTERADAVGTLVPGAEASFLVLRESDVATIAAGLARQFADSTVLGAVVSRGEVVHWGSRPRPDDRPSVSAEVLAGQTDERRVGTWIDETGFLHQHLGSDGRYDETRGGRPHAFQGRYWIDGDRIDYLDDLGFWAYGDFVDDVLHHAGYTLRRRP